MIWDAYNDKTLFITGSTGFVGSALLVRLLSRSDPKRVYLLIRGGAKGAASKWAKLLGPHAEVLVKDSRIVILDGDMQAIDFGLSDSDLDTIRTSVNYIIHAASSIHLRMKPRELSYSVIAPSVFLARLAFSSPKLERFVFVSTAYANAHLWAAEGAKDDVRVGEAIHPLIKGEDHLKAATAAWRGVQKRGTSAEFEASDFPWGYAYAKHLTERLLTAYAFDAGVEDKLLIVRPSVIGPAQRLPFPGFSTATSTPTTACATAFVLFPAKKMLFASRLDDPGRQSTIDEVPVDIVVDRILAHLAAGTVGVVHAVSGAKGRISIDDWAAANNIERRLPWKIKVCWIKDDWNSRKVCQLARIFKIVGASYDFAEGKTEILAESLLPQDRDDLDLFTGTAEEYSLKNRRDQIRELAIDHAKRKGWPIFLVKLLCRKQKVTLAELAVASLPEITEKSRRAESGESAGWASDTTTPVDTPDWPENTEQEKQLSKVPLSLEAVVHAP